MYEVISTEKELLMRKSTSQRKQAGSESAELLKEMKEVEQREELEAKLFKDEQARLEEPKNDFPNSIKDPLKHKDSNTMPTSLY